MSEPDSLAIVGMSGRFPGASSPEAFWENLLAGRDGISHFDDPELSVATPEARAQGVQFVGARGILENVAQFDADFFGIQPREAELMDPQHRVFLECGWEAIESAGYDPALYAGLIGVYASLSLNTYLLHNLSGGAAARLPAQYQVGEYAAMLGNDKDFLPTRLAYKLNLRGPCMAIQTACSSSLVAIAQACTALQTYQCDMALAGGVSISFPQKRDYRYQEEGMVSPDGTCRAFDAAAQGTVFGHGCGIVLLKRLEDAQADGDTILALIRGSAVNNDGANKIGYAAPSVGAQAEVIALAQAAANVTPDSISCIEAHGTGTPLGDPIEVAALSKAFREGGATKNAFCHLATAKTHIGHLDVASGAVGLIKTVLQLQHGCIPALRHFQSPNPRIDFANSPFRLVTENTEWVRGTEPRRAGVSAFGVGGTNAHIVVEEAPLAAPVSATGSRRSQVLLLSARSPAALDAARENLATHLEMHPETSLADLAFTLARGRRAFSVRRSGVVGSPKEAIALLRQPGAPRSSPDSAPGVVFLFPGQGAQSPNMGRELYENEPVFRVALDEAAAILKTHLGKDLLPLLYPEEPDTANQEIHQTQLAQPALFLIQYALFRLWQHWGIKPAAVVGHSVGEFTAAVVVGALTLDEALRLLATRARLMQDLPAGQMLAVRCPASELDLSAHPDLSLAAVNGPSLSVVSGPGEAMDIFRAELKSRQVPLAPLTTSHAFHSAMMEPVMAPLRQLAADTVNPKPWSIPWASTCSGEFMRQEDLADPGYWARQLREPVRFAAAVTVLADTGFDTFLECGPGSTLSTLTRQNVSAATAISSLGSGPEDTRAIQAALGQLWQVGVAPDWDSYFAGESLTRIPLPTYPFERKHFWVPAPAAASPLPPAQAEPLPTAPAIEAEPTAAPSSEPAPNRESTLIADLSSLLLELSGREEIDPDILFTDLGFDSLFLTQVSQSLLSRYGLRIAFRQLLGELSSVRALATHLDATLPPDRGAEPVAAAESDARFGLPAIRRAASPQTAASSASPRFGPYRPLEIRPDNTLTAQQREGLDALIARYTSRTASSKAHTAEHRSHYADPRAVAGFQSLWKEMVYPIVSQHSKGSQIRDIDGNTYIDVTMGFGTYFFGHSPDWLVRALEDQLREGIEIGPQSPAAGAIARDLCRLTGHDRVTFCNTGSEAVMAALRLARTVTGRNRVAYFTGDYHGMFDEVLVRGTWIDGEYRAQAAAPGIPPSSIANMLVLDYAAPDSLEILRAHAHELAAVLVEPVQSRQPDLQPRAFLQELRSITSRAGAALIFDEVVTGFRCHPGGAQAYFGVAADLATYGKVVGGGIPIGILAGSRPFMDPLDGGTWSYGDESVPEVGMTFFAGTFVRHPLAMAAAKAVLAHIQTEGPGLQLRMAERTATLCRALNDHCAAVGVPLRFPHFSAFAVLEHAPDLPFASLLWYHLRARGIHIWENRPLYLTTAHSDEDFDAIISAFSSSIAEMQKYGFLPAPPLKLKPITPEARPFPRFDRAPVTEAQREIWSSAQMGEDANRAFNESNTIRFEGPLDRPALEKALLHIVQRHPALRSSFSEDGDWQHFHPAPEQLHIGHPDLSALPEAVQATRLAEMKAEGTGVAFDLVEGPLLRLDLITLSPECHDLIFSAHHLVCDGWSFGMIVDELSHSYNAFRAGTMPLLPPPLTFGDYARDLAAAGIPESNREYWVGLFRESLPNAIELPGDRPRPALKSSRGAMASRALPASTCQALQDCGARLGGTLFATLLTAYATLLHRISGQDDLVIGVPAAGQTLAGRDELVGHCLNFLPLRLKTAVDSSFADFFRATHHAILDAHEHQGYTFGSLVRELKIPRDASRLPLVSVMFNIDKSGFENLQFDGLRFKVSTNAKQFVNFDLFFNLVQDGEGILVECEYNTDHFDSETIARWLQAYEVLIDGILAAPESATLDRLPLMHPEEEARITALHSRTCPYPRETPVHTLIRQEAERHPDRMAIADDSDPLSYGDLEVRANALAVRLAAAGLGPGLLAGIFLTRSPNLVVGLLAILKTGAAYVPMDPEFPSARLAGMIADSAMPVLLTQTELVDRLPPHQAKLVLVESPEASPAPDFSPVEIGGEAPAYVIFTSGSTGKPKGVRIPHRALTNFLLSMQKEPGLNAEDHLLAVTTLSFDISGLEILLPLITGARLSLLPSCEAADGLALRNALEGSGITIMQATPSTWRLLLEAGWKGSPHLKILIGGEAVPRELAEALIPCCGSLWNMYGPTETTIWSTIARLSGGPVSIGLPIANTSVHIVNPALTPQPVGVPGELLIGGEGLALDYLNRPELTAEKFLPDPFSSQPGARLYRSGDLARLRPDGSLECLGRLDDQVKVHGHRIELGEIESVLARHPNVQAAVATVRRDGPGRARLLAYVVARHPDEQLAEALRDAAAAELPASMVPTRFIELPDLPLTPNGKIDRRALPEPDSLAEKPSAPPANETERKLARFCQEVLEREQIGREDDLFAAGADSILIFKIATRAREAGLPLAPAAFFQHRTIAALAASIPANTAPAPSAPQIRRVDRSNYRRQS